MSVWTSTFEERNKSEAFEYNNNKVNYEITIHGRYKLYEIQFKFHFNWIGISFCNAVDSILVKYQVCNCVEHGWYQTHSWPITSYYNNPLELTAFDHQSLMKRIIALILEVKWFWYKQMFMQVIIWRNMCTNRRSPKRHWMLFMLCAEYESKHTAKPFKRPEYTQTYSARRTIAPNKMSIKVTITKIKSFNWIAWCATKKKNYHYWQRQSLQLKSHQLNHQQRPTRETAWESLRVKIEITRQADRIVAISCKSFSWPSYGLSSFEFIRFACNLRPSIVPFDSPTMRSLCRVACSV